MTFTGVIRSQPGANETFWRKKSDERGRRVRSPVGRDERPKRGLEALADPQDQGATVKKKKETRMSREASNLGLTAHQVRHQTGRSNIQSSKWVRAPRATPK